VAESISGPVRRKAHFLLERRRQSFTSQAKALRIGAGFGGAWSHKAAGRFQ
jgi:hypothetical protein